MPLLRLAAQTALLEAETLSEMGSGEGTSPRIALAVNADSMATWFTGVFDALGDVLFDTGKASLKPGAYATIERLAAALKDVPARKVMIEGHTDSVGDKKFNERLGLNRAEAVKRYLYEQHQVPLHKINVISYGEEKPVSPNKTREGRAQNRRVVIRVLS